MGNIGKIEFLDLWTERIHITITRSNSSQEEGDKLDAVSLTLRNNTSHETVSDNNWKSQDIIYK